MTKILSLLVLCLSALSAWAGGSKKEPEHVDRQLLVAFKDAAAAESRAEVFASVKAREVQNGKISESGFLYLVEVPAGTPLREAIKTLQKFPGVKYAEPNLIMRTMPVPSGG